jgi:uncharacterized protein YlxW (UPF0749 family)
MEVMEMQVNAGDLVARLEAATTLLERTQGWLEERQRFLSGEVDLISATVETSRREEELMAKLASAEAQVAELMAAIAPVTGAGLSRVLEPLRRTLPSSATAMLAKHGIGDTAVDVRTLDAALVGLSLEQRIAVKSQLRRAGAMA